MTIRVITPPQYEPVSRALAKQWMVIGADDASDDSLVDMIVAAMREDAENLTHRAFVQRTLRLYLDQWPVVPGPFGNMITLPWPPLVSVTSIQYRDLNGDLQTLATDQYVVHDWKEPAIIVPAWTAVWPVIRRVPDAVQVNFVAGYPDGSPSGTEQSAQDNLPEKLKLWMHTKGATMYQNREQLMQGNSVKVPRDFTDGLLDSLIVGTRMF